MMEPERTTIITIDGKEYALLLTTRATKEISKRYGGLDKLGEKLMQADNFELALDQGMFMKEITRFLISSVDCKPI